MFKEKKPFTLSSKFQLTREFFNYFSHFTDNDFKVYVQHLLGRTPGRVAAYPKVMVHKANHVHTSHHTGHEWVERRKQKRVIFGGACGASARSEVHGTRWSSGR